MKKVADLVHNKVIEGISDYHTDLKDGIKITITLKRDANPQVVLNNLYKHTEFQKNFGIIFLMLDNGTPKTLGLKDIISKYVDYQREVIIRRTQFELKKAEARVHILEGFKIALDNIDEVIKIIKEAESDDEAKTKLQARFGLDEIQSDAILEMKLRRLTGLERTKIENELADLLKEIDRLRLILSSDANILAVIKEELLEIKGKYGDERRTTIDMTAIDFIEDESLIPVEDIIITLTNKGYIKRVQNDTFKVQNRGGVGIKGMGTNEEDFPEKLISMKTHDYVLMFSNFGKVYRMKGYEVPEFSRQSKGLPIVNLIPIEKDEKVTSMVMVKAEEEENKYLVFVTKKGVIKRTSLEEFESIRNNGKKAIVLREDDELISVKKSDGTMEIAVGADNGRMVRFDENEVRIMGRSSSGVKAIDFEETDNVVGAEVVTPDKQILVVTENGYGKKTNVEEYRKTHRGSKGVKALNTTEKTGKMVSLRSVEGNEDLIIITDGGITVRLTLEQVSSLGRNTQGVRLIKLKDDQKVSTVTTIIKTEEDEESENASSETVEELTETVENSVNEEENA